MPGSPTTPSCPRARVDALEHMAFRYTDSVGTRDQFSIAAQWLACTYPYRRFAAPLTDGSARLGADVVRYSFIVGDLHPLLLAGLPAHLCENFFEACFQGSSDPSPGGDRRSWINLEGRLFEIARVFGVFTQPYMDTARFAKLIFM